VKQECRPEIDADLSPKNLHNVEVAKRLNWKYDERRKMYRDKDGYLIADKFGQPLG